MKPSALIVVDVQEDFVEGGVLACPGGRDLATRISEYAQGSDHFVIASRDWHIPYDDNGGHFAVTDPTLDDDQGPDYVDTWPIHCVSGTRGAEYAKELILPARTYHVLKGQGEPAYSAFDGQVTGGGVHLNSLLTDLGIEQVLVCGIALSYCVKATALDSVQFGYDTRLLDALCVEVPDVASGAALAEMHAAGVTIVGTPAWSQS